MIDLSVIIPVYGCKDCLLELHRQLTKTLQTSSLGYEVIFVDDCSKDHAWDLIQILVQKDPHIKGVKFSRNFGQQAAISAGFAESSGQYAVVMDCDLQDPPHEILNLYKKAREGYDIVYSKRREKKHSIFRRIASILHFQLMKNGSTKNLKFDSTYTGFSLVSRKVITEFLRFPEAHKDYLFLLKWLGFNSSYIEYEHAQRFCGTSSYTFTKLLSLASQSLISHTTTLLKLIIYFGFLISGVSFSLSFYYIARYFFHAVPIGWTSIVVLILMMSGMIMISIGVLGVYIAKIFEQVKNRPHYVIEEKEGDFIASRVK